MEQSFMFLCRLDDNSNTAVAARFFRCVFVVPLLCLYVSLYGTRVPRTWCVYVLYYEVGMYHRNVWNLIVTSSRVTSV